MINGKISRLPMDALLEMMESMNSDNIESIELITTPSAKYDAEGDGGMINIVIPTSDEMNNPNVVKVITDLCNRALYFSRSAIPHQQSKETRTTVYKHVGVYAFRKSALIDFYEHAPTPLELAEQIEAIRYLEMGKTIQMIETQFDGVGIDVPEDLEYAKKLMS